MDASPFAKLPPELRNTIYEMVCYQPKLITFWMGDITTCETPHWQALTQTCKAIRAESLSVFYGTNAFQITRRPTGDESHYYAMSTRYVYQIEDQMRLHSWLDMVGDGVPFRQEIVLDLGYWELHDKRTEAMAPTMVQVVELVDTFVRPFRERTSARVFIRFDLCIAYCEKGRKDPLRWIMPTELPLASLNNTMNCITDVIVAGVREIMKKFCKNVCDKHFRQVERCRERLCEMADMLEDRGLILKRRAKRRKPLT